MGSVRGQVASDYRVFQSIPYAAPPVGPLRWQLPRPAARWSGMLDATKAGPQCMQDTGPNPRVGKPTSENCLTLNVWTPAARTTQREAPGDGVDPRGRLRQRQRRHLSRALVGGQGPHRRRHDQLPVGCARFPGSPVARCARHGRQLRAGRPAGRAALGPRQHRRVRWRSAEGDHRRRIRGRHVGVRSPGGAGLGRAVPRGDHPERAVSGAGRSGVRAAPEHGLRDRGRLSQSRHHRAVSACAAGDPSSSVHPGTTSSATPMRSPVRSPERLRCRTIRWRDSPPTGQPEFRC